MSDILMSWLGRGGYLPHGYCFTWSPGLLWSMVGADAVIAASYYSIPIALVHFARRRPDVQFKGLLWLFSAFIFACGTTHVLDIWTIWQPDYAWLSLVKMLTAAVSLVTAVALWPLIPKALQIPSVRQLQGVIDSLEAEARKRRSAEENLSDAQQSLAVTLASIGAGFIATDRAGQVVHMNQVAEDLTGWGLAQAQGRDLWEVFQREGRPAAYLKTNPVDLMIEQRITLDNVHHLTSIARDGKRNELEAKAALTHAPDGSVRGLAMVFRDIGRLKRAEAESSRLAAIVASSYDAIIGKTLDGHITSWNRAAERLFGYAADEVIGQPVQMLMPPQRQHEESEILVKLARGEAVPPFDTVRRAKDGRLIDVAVTISPIRDAEGRIIGASKIARDVSGQRLAEEARLKAKALEAENRQIQEANRLKSEFLANMSHELRTPLNAIIGFADLLYAGKVAPDSPKQKVFVDHIRTSGRHLLQLINDILDLSKVESGRFEFFPEPVDLRELSGEVMNVLHGQAATKAIQVRIEIDPAVEQLVIDAQRLKQVLYNYLSNALKFTPQDGRVVVRAMPEDEHLWRLQVEDTGIGIRPEDIGRLFTEFQQLDGGLTKRHAGTGLGLALTRRLVEAQGGSVGVRSEPGAGAVFHALLPRRAAVTSAEPGASGGADPARSIRARDAVSQDDRLVVVADPDRPSRDLLTSVLASAGYAAAACAEADEALALIDAVRPAALVIDLAMPGLDVFEMLERLRATPTGAELPVFVWSSRDLTPLDHQRLRGKAHSVTMKSGTDVGQLLGHIEACFAQR